MIRIAEPTDAARLAELAARTFQDTYAALNDPNVLAIHMAKSFGVPHQLSELQDPLTQTLLAEIAGESVAFAQLSRDSHPLCVTDEWPIELRRFYVDQRWHGRGVAQRLMAEVRARAESFGAKTIWLGVWERNERAMAFYRKCGFVLVGEHEFVFGDQPAMDLVMVCNISELNCERSTRKN